MAIDGVPSQRGSTGDLARTWQGQLRYWHILAVAVWAAQAVSVLSAAPDAGARLISLALLLVIAVAYAIWGHVALRTQRPGPAYAYLVVTWVAHLALLALVPPAESWILYFILFPQMWAMLSREGAVVLSVVATVSVALVSLRFQADEPGDLRWIVANAVLMISMSVGLGLFIEWLMGQASSRAELIDDLVAARSRLAEAERRQGVDAERRRVSREIHDTLAQDFTSVAALAQAAGSALERGDVSLVAERLGLIERTARDGLSEARLMVAEMTPGQLQERTLAEAMERLVATVSRESGIEGSFDAGEVDGPAPARDVLLLRTAQEALANMRRHSRASSFSVRMTAGPDTVDLVIRDDGVGFDPAARRAGFGLDSLTARARDAGGRLSLSSAPGEGTTVSLQVPR